MYKVSSSAVPRTALPCINKTFFYNTDNIEKTPKREAKKRQEVPDITQVSLTDIRLRAVGRSRSTLSPSSTPSSTPSTPSSAEIELQMSILDKSWKRFAFNENGEPDSSIIQYTPKKKSPPSDFRPVDLDMLFAEHLLREVNIDPKVVLA